MTTIRYARKFIASENNSDNENLLTLVTKKYVDDNLFTNSNTFNVSCATVSSLVCTFSPGTLTTFATISIVLEPGFDIDNVILALGMKILVKDQALSNQNGVYIVSTLQTSLCVLSRVKNARLSKQFVFGMNAIVLHGSINTNTCWYLNVSDVIELDVSGVDFVSYSGIDASTSEFDVADGLMKTDTVIDLVLDEPSQLIVTGTGLRLGSVVGRVTSLLANTNTINVTNIAALVASDIALANRINNRSASITTITSGSNILIDNANIHISSMNTRLDNDDLALDNTVTAKNIAIDHVVAMNSALNPLLSTLQNTKIDSIGTNLVRTGNMVDLSVDLVQMQSINALPSQVLTINNNSVFKSDQVIHSCNVSIEGNLTVAGNLTTVSQGSIDVMANVMVLNKTGTTNASANTGGLILKGASNKHILYSSALDQWESNIAVVSPNISVLKLDSEVLVASLAAEIAVRSSEDSAMQTQINGISNQSSLVLKDLNIQNDIDGKLPLAGGSLSSRLTNTTGGIKLTGSASVHPLRINSNDSTLNQSTFNSFPADTCVLNQKSPNNNTSLNPPAVVFTRAGVNNISYPNTAAWILDRSEQGTLSSKSRLRFQLTEGNNNVVKEPIQFTTTGVVLPLGTPNTVLALDANKKIVSSITTTQLALIDGLTANAQTQLNLRVPLTGAALTGPLAISKSTNGKKVALYDVTNNNHQYYGISVATNALECRVNATTSDHVFYSGLTPTTSTELLRIKGNGKVIPTSLTPNTIVVTGTDGSLASSSTTTTNLNQLIGSSLNIQTRLNNTIRSAQNTSTTGPPTTNSILCGSGPTTLNWVPTYQLPYPGVFGNGGHSAYTVTPGSTYSMISDRYWSTLTVLVGGTIKTNGYRIFASQSVVCAGLITNAGLDSVLLSGVPLQGTGGVGSILLAATNGGIPSTANGLISTASKYIGGKGGNGGNGKASNGATTLGGAQQTVVLAPANGGYEILNTLPYALTCSDTSERLCPSTGGGSGGGSTSNYGGGGGGGGGHVVIASPYIQLSGTIDVSGGNGLSMTNANLGGGGGGGGGCVILVAATLNRTDGLINTSGGSAGTASTNATSGTSGSIGRIFLLCNELIA